MLLLRTPTTSVEPLLCDLCVGTWTSETWKFNRSTTLRALQTPGSGFGSASNHTFGQASLRVLRTCSLRPMSFAEKAVRMAVVTFIGVTSGVYIFTPIVDNLKQQVCDMSEKRMQ